MTVKLVLLKSGEEVISDMKEMAAGLDKDSQQVIGYVFDHPCRVKLYGNDVDTETGTALPVKMRLLPWMPLAKDEAIPVVADWVISIMEPVDKLKEMYQKVLDRYEQRKSKDSSSDESTTNSESD